MKLFLLALGALLMVGAGWGIWQASTAEPRDPGATASPTANTNVANNTPTGSGAPLPFDLQVEEGFQIGIFAEDLQAARDLVFSPGQTLLVSVPDAGQIIALPDEDNDGMADRQQVVLENLINPHGVAFYNGQLFVAEETQLRRYHWNEDALQAELDTKLLDLPAGGRHDTRSLTFDPQGNLYLSIGSTCDTCFEEHDWISTVIRTNANGDNPQVYANGLRNAVFLTTKPDTNEVWVTEMGRDFLGPEAPPDEVNILEEGGNYGWPLCYGDRVYDEEFGQGSPKDCADTIAPVYHVPAHSAPLGLTFITSNAWPEQWQGDLLVAYHGSWNRPEPRGYKVVRLAVEGQTVTDSTDLITQWYADGNTNGRPVDLEFDDQGNLFISDDYAGYVYKVNRVEPFLQLQ